MKIFVNTIEGVIRGWPTYPSCRVDDCHILFARLQYGSISHVHPIGRKHLIEAVEFNAQLMFNLMWHICVDTKNEGTQDCHAKTM